MVVGTHQRRLGERVWHGSISRNIVHEATSNVLCVPQRDVAGHVAPSPRVVVVPTDFSALADRAIPFGYAQLGSGGTLHLVHTAPSASQDQHDALKAQLQTRIPKEATETERGITTELHVLIAETPWQAIWQHAGRVSADLILMSNHSRSAAASVVLGSQAQAILQHSRIPCASAAGRER